jgi:hypothetical protein
LGGQFEPKLGGQFELESGGQFAPKWVVNLVWNWVVNLTVFSTYAFHYDKNRELIVDGSSYGHEVLYDGYWDENTGSWQCDWEILNESGVFHARKYKSKGRIGRFEMRMIE